MAVAMSIECEEAGKTTRQVNIELNDVWLELGISLVLGRRRF